MNEAQGNLFAEIEIDAVPIPAQLPALRETPSGRNKSRPVSLPEVPPIDDPGIEWTEFTEKHRRVLPGRIFSESERSKGMIGEHDKWKAVTVKEARELSKQGYLIWWRPNLTNFSKSPDHDPAWVLQ